MLPGAATEFDDSELPAADREPCAARLLSCNEILFLLALSPDVPAPAPAPSPSSSSSSSSGESNYSPPAGSDSLAAGDSPYKLMISLLACARGPLPGLARTLAAYSCRLGKARSTSTADSGCMWASTRRRSRLARLWRDMPGRAIADSVPCKDSR